MNKVRITKQYEFEMAHALWNYNGLCKNLHGHSYKLHVTILGTPNTDKTNPKLGMVIDFGDLKRIVKDEIVDKMDHSIVINSEAPVDKIKQLGELSERIIVLDYQPTCENMVIDMAQKIKRDLPDDVKLIAVRLYETSSSYAEWNAEDNK